MTHAIIFRRTHKEAVGDREGGQRLARTQSQAKAYGRCLGKAYVDHLLDVPVAWWSCCRYQSYSSRELWMIGELLDSDQRCGALGPDQLLPNPKHHLPPCPVGKDQGRYTSSDRSMQREEAWWTRSRWPDRAWMKRRRMRKGWFGYHPLRWLWLSMSTRLCTDNTHMHTHTHQEQNRAQARPV